MKAILVSVPPEVCERIANGEQTLLLMKRIPKLDAPYKVYMYETKALCSTPTFIDEDGHIDFHGRGQVISSFICRGIMHPNDCLKLMAEQSCMSEAELDKSAKGKTPYGLCMTDLTVFDKPKELGEFYSKTNCEYANTGYCKICTDDCKYHNGGFYHSLTRPPQSWCYVEELSK